MKIAVSGLNLVFAGVMTIRTAFTKLTVGSVTLITVV